MQFIVWNKEYDTGIPLIDAQHKNLIDLANKLYEATKQGKEIKIIQNILEGLTNYISKHFAKEEALLKEIQYPEYDEQVEAHRSFTREFQEYTTGKDILEVSGELFGFIKKWIIEHFLGMDKKYVLYLAHLSNKQGTLAKSTNKTS